MINVKTHYKWPCSIAFCMFTRPGNNRRIFQFSSKPDDRLPNCTPHRIKSRNHQKPSKTCWFHGTSKPENTVKICKNDVKCTMNLLSTSDFLIQFPFPRNVAESAGRACRRSANQQICCTSPPNPHIFRWPPSPPENVVGGPHSITLGDVQETLAFSYGNLAVPADLRR